MQFLHRLIITKNHQQKLIGRTLQHNVYVNERCIAICNQNITSNLAFSLMTLKKTNFYTHGNLIELGKGSKHFGEWKSDLTVITN